MTIVLKRSEVDAMGLDDGGTGPIEVEIDMIESENKPGVIVPDGASAFGTVNGPFRFSFWMKLNRNKAKGNRKTL